MNETSGENGAVNKSRRDFFKIGGTSFAAGIVGGFTPEIVKNLSDTGRGSTEISSNIDRWSQIWIDELKSGNLETLEITTYLMESYKQDLNRQVDRLSALHKAIVDKSLSEGSKAILKINIEQTEQRIRFLQVEIDTYMVEIENALKKNSDTKKSDLNKADIERLRKTM